MEYYVYILQKLDFTPFYVGKGCGDRVHHHVREARRHAGVNPHKERIIRKMLAHGHKPVVRIDSIFEYEALAFAREVELIEELGRHNLGTGPLTNLTAGGDGVVGNVITQEVRERMSVARRRYFERDPGAREAQRQRLAALHDSEAFQEARRACVQRQKADPEFEARRRAAHAAKMADPDHLASVKEAARQQWLDESFRAKHVERNRAMARDPKNLEANAAAARERWASGTYAAALKSVMVDGVTYSSMTKAAEALGLSIGTLSARFRRYAAKKSFPEGYGYVDVARAKAA